MSTPSRVNSSLAASPHLQSHPCKSPPVRRGKAADAARPPSAQTALTSAPPRVDSDTAAAAL
eukprot:2173840-Alexandrium_andersonii.AAC.1